MKAIAYAGKTFSSLNVKAGFPAGMQAGPSKSPILLDRAGEPPIHVTTRQDARTWTVEFVVLSGNDVEETIMTLLGALDPASQEPRVFVAEITGTGANTGVQVETLMTTGQYRMGGVNNIFVDFHAADDRWYEREATVLPQLISTGSLTVPLNNKGGATVSPIIKVGYSTQRTTESSSVGWKYRRTVTITNSGTRNWNKVRKTIVLGDTAALVTAVKAQADGDDLRVWFEGRNINRTLTNWNTKWTLCHIDVTIPAGESAEYEIVYGNPDATTATTLSTRTGTGATYAADDLEGTSGTATSGGGSTMTDSGAAWETNRWRYGYIYITGGTGSGQRRRIASNTGTAITVDRAWTTNPAAASTYVIWMTGVSVNGGAASGAGTTTSLTDSSQAFGVNELKGGSLYNVTKGIGPFTIQSNTATVITTSTMTAPALNDVYYIERYGVIQYSVNGSVTETAHRGLWRINKYFSKGARTSYGDQVPGGWIPWLMVANNDDFAQGRYVDEGSGGGHAINNWPQLYARRSFRSDNTWPEEGQADGAAFYDPRGFVGFDWNYNMQNEGGVGQVVVMTQEPDGDDWQTIATDSTTRATAVSVTSGNAAGYWDLTGDDAEPVRIYCGVIPADGEVIPSTQKKGRKVQLKNQNKHVVYLSLDDCGGTSGSLYTVGNEAAMYDLQATLRIGGGASSTPPYDKISIGSKLGLASGQRLWIDPSPTADSPLFAIYNSSDALVRRTPWAARIRRYDTDLDGATTALVSRDFLPIRIGGNILGTSADRVTGWTLSNGAGVTSTIANVTTPDYDGNSKSIDIDITATPAGAWSLTLESALISLIPGTMYEFGMVARRSSVSAGVIAKIGSYWQSGLVSSAVDADTEVSQTLVSNAAWYPMGSGKKVHTGSAITEPTDGTFIIVTISGSGSVTGHIYLDMITLGVPNLYINEDEPGTTTVDVEWTEAYFG